jgi:hypothetical protein
MVLTLAARLAVLLTVVAGAVVFTPRPSVKEPEPILSETIEYVYYR